MVQYRGTIMPLVHVSLLLGSSPAKDAERESLRVLVSGHDNQEIGLVVDRILDVVTCPGSQRLSNTTYGFVGTAVVNQQVVDILDIPSVLATMREG